MLGPEGMLGPELVFGPESGGPGVGPVMARPGPVFAVTPIKYFLQVHRLVITKDF